MTMTIASIREEARYNPTPCRTLLPYWALITFKGYTVQEAKDTISLYWRQDYRDLGYLKLFQILRKAGRLSDYKLRHRQYAFLGLGMKERQLLSLGIE